MNKIILFILGSFVFLKVSAQTKVPYSESKEFKIAINEKATHYVKLTFLNQVWLRYNESNPGTLVYDTPKSETYDIGLRRTRLQLFGQLSDRIFVYTQFGQNNISYASARKQGIYFLDAVTEFTCINRYLSIGAGLTGWNGVARYAAPSVGTILTMDAPLYQQATNDINDQFLRKLSIYAKGKIAKLDYRLVVSNPMSVQNASAPGGTLGSNSSFSTLPGKIQTHAYFNYQFLDEESNLIPYTIGSYLGKKSVFNIGAGFLVQKDAMWHLNPENDTVQSDLKLFSFDIFYDVAINKEKKNAITAYAAFQNSDYGVNYYRCVGAMNPANGVNSNGSLNGPGNAFPIIGTGNTIYLQFGYLFKDKLLGELGTIQPYFGIQQCYFQAMDDPFSTVDLGVNWLMDGHRSKLSLNYQNRAIFNTDDTGKNVVSDHKGMVVLQYQIAL